MHELGIAQTIQELACEAAEGQRVVRVEVEVGVLRAVLPDALRFCWDLVCSGTIAQGSLLVIKPCPATARCHACLAETELPAALARCPCGGQDLSFLSGDELRIVAVEVVCA